MLITSPLGVLIDADATANFAATNGQPAEIREVRCQVTRSTDVYIPIPKLVPHPSSAHKKKLDVDENEEDWNADMGALFEWAGMACLGAQRSVFLCLVSVADVV